MVELSNVKEVNGFDPAENPEGVAGTLQRIIDAFQEYPFDLRLNAEAHDESFTSYEEGDEGTRQLRGSLKNLSLFLDKAIAEGLTGQESASCHVAIISNVEGEKFSVARFQYRNRSLYAAYMRQRVMDNLQEILGR